MVQVNDDNDVMLTDRSMSINNSGVFAKAEINLDNIQSNFSSIVLESEKEMNNDRDRLFEEEN